MIKFDMVGGGSIEIPAINILDIEETKSGNTMLWTVSARIQVAATPAAVKELVGREIMYGPKSPCFEVGDSEGLLDYLLDREPRVQNDPS